MDQENTYKVGDIIRVSQKVHEGKRDRIVPFQGTLMRIKGKDENKMITVRTVLDGVEVDRIFPINLPSLTEIKVVQKPKGRIHRARLMKIPHK